jgi:hypothetical protein
MIAFILVFRCVRKNFVIFGKNYDMSGKILLFSEKIMICAEKFLHVCEDNDMSGKFLELTSPPGEKF